MLKSLYISLVIGCLALFAGPVKADNTVSSALSSLKISGYLQEDYSKFQNPKDGTNGFTLLRANVKLTSQPSDRVGFVIESDVAGGYVLKDCYFTFKANPNLCLTGGQFGVPFGFEGPQSDRVRETYDRARWSKALFPDKRDRGVLLVFTPNKTTDFTIGGVNGAGSNKSDDDGKTDLLARVQFLPNDRVHLGFSGYFGHKLVSGVDGTKNRVGVDTQIFLGKVEVRGEYVRADEVVVNPVGYTAMVIVPISNTTRLFGKYDSYDDGLGGVSPNGKLTTTTLGLIHNFDKALVGKLSYSRENQQTHTFDDNAMRAELQVNF